MKEEKIRCYTFYYSESDGRGQREDAHANIYNWPPNILRTAINWCKCINQKKNPILQSTRTVLGLRRGPTWPSRVIVLLG